MKILIVLLFALAPEARANGLAGYQRASTGAPFLRIGASAAGLAMGEAYTAVAADASAVFWNPANLAELTGRSATFMHSSYLGGLTLDGGAYAQKLPADLGALGASVQYLSAGSITQTDESGVEQGAFNPYDLAVGLSYAYRFKDHPQASDEDGMPIPDGFAWLNGYSLGASAKFVRSRISARSQTATFDLGLLSPRYFSGRLRFAAAVQNLGGVLRFDVDNEVLPFVGKAGLAWTPLSSLTIALDGILPRDIPAYAAVGAEWRRTLGGRWSAALRAGFNSQTLNDVTGFHGVSAGLGLGYGLGQIDYAFVPFGTLGTTQQVSVSAKF